MQTRDVPLFGPCCFSSARKTPAFCCRRCRQPLLHRDRGAVVVAEPNCAQHGSLPGCSVIFAREFDVLPHFARSVACMSRG